MDRELGPWKMAFFNGPASLKNSVESVGSLTKCKPNVDQEERPCTKK